MIDTFDSILPPSHFVHERCEGTGGVDAHFEFRQFHNKRRTMCLYRCDRCSQYAILERDVIKGQWILTAIRDALPEWNDGREEYWAARIDCRTGPEGVGQAA